MVSIAVQFAADGCFRWEISGGAGCEGSTTVLRAGLLDGPLSPASTDLDAGKDARAPELDQQVQNQHNCYCGHVGAILDPCYKAYNMCCKVKYQSHSIVQAQMWVLVLYVSMS